MDSKQTTNHLLMVRPAHFAFNEETAGSNAFQQRSGGDATNCLQRQALEEFDNYVGLLRQNGVEVTVVQDTADPFTPDSIFPNNCVSTHHDTSGRLLVIYPMHAHNRRKEREKLCQTLRQMTFDKVVDLTHWEAEGRFLEGTGSLILDRDHHMAYACRSPRTHEDVVREWARATGYDFFLFDSEDDNGTPVYHTNVMMHVGTKIAIVCMDSIRNDGQRKQLLSLLEDNGKEVVEITMAQMHLFAGNMLEVRNNHGEQLLVMSKTARMSLTDRQTSLLTRDMRIVAPDIHTIETVGGGSARCMIAEVFL
jgi:hypothetical protein